MQLLQLLWIQVRDTHCYSGNPLLECTTIPPAPSASPSSVSVSEVTSSSITVQWGPVDCIHRNGAITGYSVQYGNETVSVSGDSSGGMYVISGLMPSTTYSIQVAAKTSAGTGPYSTAIDQLTSGMIQNFSVAPQHLKINYTRIHR